MLRNSIRNRLTIGVISLAVIPLLMTGILMLWRTYTVQRQQVLTLESEIAENVSDQVLAFINERETELSVAGRVRGLQSQPPIEQRNILSELLAYQRAFDDLALLDIRGQEVVRVSRLEVVTSEDLTDRSDAPEFRIPMETGETYYGPVVVDPTTAQLVMQMSIPLIDVRTGTANNVLIANLRLRFIESILAEVDAAESVYIINASGRVVAHPNSSVVLRGEIFELPEEDGIHQGLQGNDVVLAFHDITLGDQTLIAVTEEPVSNALALVVNNAYLLAVILMVALFLAIATVIASVRIIILPLENLAGVAREIQAGDLSLRADISSKDEIGQLGQAFNSMTNRLSQMLEDLERRVTDRTRDLQLAVDVSQQIATLLKTDELLYEVVTRIRETFSLYGVHILFVDEKNNQLVMKSGTGDYVNTQVTPELNIPITMETSLIARATRTRETVIVNDVSADKNYLYVETLPHTRSEMVVPILRAERLLGVLDLQSTNLDNFGDNDARVMTTLARQLAVAIENARLFEEQLSIAEELRALDKLKSQFLANMSHELRTPLNAIINFTEFVANGTFGEVNDRQHESLTKVMISGRHLLSLINDILDLSKIEAGMLQLFVQEFNLNDVIEIVKATSQGLEISEDVQLVFDIPDNLPTMTGDKRRVRQILINLMSNAVKFTKQGSVTLSIKAHRDIGTIEFRVKDTGPGISPEEIELIFEPFQQTEEGVGHGGGTGLGLPISRYLAEAHGGKILVESQVGHGATFIVHLPLHQQKSTKRG